MPEEELETVGPQQEVIRKSVVTPSLIETARLVQMKENFETGLNSNFADPMRREELIRYSNILYNELRYILTAREKNAIENVLKDMGELQDRLTKEDARTRLLGSPKIMNLNLNASRSKDLNDLLNCAYDFLNVWNAAGVNHDILGARSKKQISEFKKIYSVLEAPNMFYNSFGIPVSMETEFLSRCYIQRTYAKRDNLIFIEGPPGQGKDTFADALATTMASMSPLHKYSLANVFFKEDRKTIEEAIRNADPYTIFKLSEAGNQLGSKKFYEDDQIFMTNAINWLRNLGLTILILWKEATSLDSSLRKNRAVSIVSCKHRGIANVRTFNENPYATEFAYTPKYLKQKVVLGSAKASDMLGADPTTLMQIPTFSLDGTDWWEKQELKKNSGRKVNMAELANQALGLDSVLSVFMGSMKGAKIIDKKTIDAYNMKNGCLLTMEAVVKYMAAKSGADQHKFIVASNYILLPKEAQLWLSGSNAV